MAVSWIEDEVKTAEFRDQRLDRRFAEVLAQLSARPTASIPAACVGRAEIEAAYRFFDNEKVTFQQVLQPHIAATDQRIEGQAVVILAQDTTEIDVTRPALQMAGAGPLDGASRRGVFLHEMQAFMPDGTPLGTVHAEAWARDEPQDEQRSPETKSQRRARLKSTPIEDKESHRWIVALREAQALAERHPGTQIICVADSEADIFELLVEGAAQPQTASWIVRACQNRTVQPELAETTTAKKTGKKAAKTADRPSNDAEQLSAATHLREALLQKPVLFTKTIAVRGRIPKVACDTRGRRQARESRQAEVEVRAGRVTLRPPARPDRRLPEITVSAVLVREVAPPPGEEAVEWLLLTNLPIDDVEQVRQAIAYYCTRWMVEVFFRVLKGGCRVEDRRFERVDRFLNCLAVYLIVSWRTLFVCRLGREFPDIDCEAVFDPAEWKSLYSILHRQPPPSKPPTLAEMIRMVAQLGGYVNRTRPDPPGPQTVWLGLQRLHDITLCWQTFGPETRAAS